MREPYGKTSPGASVEALGQSEAFLDFQERLSRVAPVNRPVLLIGERGTGKELAAARLHYLSGRWQRPFVTLNCSSLAPALIESELFGYERGAFTGAVQRRAGRFEAGDGGTLFLDEIGAMPLVVQQKVLRVVEYNTFERVGSVTGIEVDVRIVAATHADLPGLVSRGRFTPDLLDRLSFEVLLVPPLRARAGDILLLARHFAARMATEIGRTETPEFGQAATAALERHPWPGNVRELKNVVERAVHRSDSPLITAIDFDPFGAPQAPAPPPPAPRVRAAAPPPAAGPDLLAAPLKEAVRQLEQAMLEEALTRAKFNQRKAAALLGLTYDQFRGLHRRLTRSRG
jgi:psp operon transcriptional activator